MTDGIGSTVHILSATGSVLTTYRYDAFGAVRSQSSPDDNDWPFAGEQRDPESGYDYLCARYYDPEVGRFISQDPLGGRYPYVYVRLRHAARRAGRPSGSYSTRAVAVGPTRGGCGHVPGPTPRSGPPSRELVARLLPHSRRRLCRQRRLTGQPR
jgi:RHS repeat-associated protein